MILPVHAIDHTQPNKEGTAVDSPILLSGKIGTDLVKKFVDGGGSHSLINTDIARKLRLPLDRCLPEIDARLHNPQIDRATGDYIVRMNGNNIALPRWGSPESSSISASSCTDLHIYSLDRAQRLKDIEVVFFYTDENRLLTKASKCEFLQDRLEYLGHIISANGVEIDLKKIATIQAKHAPTNLTKVKSFLGFVSYVRRFVPDMAKLKAPLTDLMRKGVEYKWGEKEQAAFSALKKILCLPPMLHIADPHHPFELVTDASDITVGSVLLRDFGNGLQPIAYESRKLHPPERNYPIHDRQMSVIVHAIKVWRCYLTRVAGQYGQITAHYSTSAPTESQSTTDPLIGLSGVQLLLQCHVQKRCIKYR
ncbi:unnamed protein product [Closterium sp. NIES-53]